MTAVEARQQLKDEVAKSGTTQKEWYRGTYLRSNHWKALRIRKLAAVGKKCDKCSATGVMDVHHLQYHNIFDVELADLQVLCRICHELEHGGPFKTANKKKKPRAKRTPRISGQLTKKQRRRQKRDERIKKKDAARVFAKQQPPNLGFDHSRPDLVKFVTARLAHIKLACEKNRALNGILAELRKIPNSDHAHRLISSMKVSKKGRLLREVMAEERAADAVAELDARFAHMAE